jgi:GNAT superfamily N-acetyltransferase
LEAALSVNPATELDIEALVRLMQAFYAESSYPLDPRWAAASFDTLISTPALGRVWIARVGAVPAGHIVLTVRYCMEFGALCGYVDDLFVEPAFRRRGVGHALLSALLDECTMRGCKSAQVEVGEANAAARALYAKRGLSAATDERVLLSCVLSGSVG